MAPKRSTLFSLEIETKLAWEVEKRLILWDVKSSAYKRADLKPVVWEDVARCLGPEYKGPAVSSRFKNMKDTFMSNQRKVGEFKSKCSGSGTDDVFKTNWPLYNVLKFLEKTCVQAASQTNIPSQAVPRNIDVDALLHPPLTTGGVMTPIQKDMMSTTLPNIYYDYNLNRYVLIQSDDTTGATEIEQVSEDNLSATAGESDIVEVVSSPPGEVMSSPPGEAMSPPSGEAMSPLSPEVLSPPPPPPRPSSAPLYPAATASSKKRNSSNESRDELFQKRGTKKVRAEALMVEVVDVLRDVCKPAQTETPAADHEEIFASYVASRLRTLDAEKKRQCEDAIMQILMKF